MTFQQLVYLVEISKYGSINKAAHALFLSQSGISTSISELENELGIVFFERSNRGVTFTPEGKEFLGYAISLLEQKNWIEDLYKATDGDESGTVSLSIASQRYPFAEAAFLQFLENHHDNRFRYLFKEEEINLVIDDVYDNRADLGILFMTGSSNQLVRHMVQSKKLEIHKLGKALPSIYVRNGHPLTAKTAVQEDDLLAYPYLAFEHKQGIAADFLEEYQTANMKRNRQFISVSERAMSYQVLKHSDAYTTGSGLLNEEITPTGIITIPIAGEPPMDICWITTQENKLPPVAFEYLDLLKFKLEEATVYTRQLQAEMLGKISSEHPEPTDPSETTDCIE